MRWRARMTTRLRRCTASTKHAPTWPARSGRWKRFTPSEGTMSIEIEVGLENAAKVKPTGELPLEEEAPKASLNSKVRGLFLLGGAVLVAAAAGLFFYFHNRESTDDAQVDGHITPVASKIYGRVAEVLVQDNEQVKAGQVLVKIDPRDYQASLDQAKAALALAESEAQSAGVDVPRTRENVASGTSSADAQLAGAEADMARAEATHDQARTADLAWARANVDKSRANAQLAQADLARYSPLLAKGEISKQQYDAAKANADATASALKADQEKLAQAERSVDITRAQLNAAKARIDQAHATVSSAHAEVMQVKMRSADAQAKLAKVQQARAALEAAQLNLSYTEIVAPVAGVSTHKQVEAGKIVLDPIPPEKAILRPGMNVDATVVTN